MKRALIIGISGQDGAYLASLLLARGYVVTGTSRNAEKADLSKLMELNLLDKLNIISLSCQSVKELSDLLNAVVPDEIYNLSGQSSVATSFDEPFGTYNSNAVCVLHLCESIRLSGRSVRLFNAGSSECFGHISTPADETTPFAPCSPYGSSKTSAHLILKDYRDSYNLHLSTGILFNHESPLRPHGFVSRKIVDAAVRIAAEGGELSVGNIDIYRDWGWAPEYMEAAWRMLQMDSPDDIVLATGVANSLRHFLKLAFDAVGLNWEDHVVTHPAFLRKADILYNCGMPGKAEAALGWKASVDFESLVHRLVEAAEIRRRRTAN